MRSLFGDFFFFFFFPGEKLHKKSCFGRRARARASSSRENDHDYECRLVLSPGDNAKRLCTRRVRFFWIVETIEEFFFTNNGLFLDTPYLSLDVPERKLPARVEHLDIRADSPIQLSKALHREVKDVTENYFQELIDFGSVYISDELEENFRLERNAVKNKMQRVTSDVVLPPNSRHYVRAHSTPRRFPVATDVQTRWNERVVKETEDFLVVWKPAGLPVMAGGQREGKRFAMREQSFIAEKRRSEELVPNP